MKDTKSGQWRKREDVDKRQILGYGFRQETGTEVGKMLLIGFILYILPVLSGWAVMWPHVIHAAHIAVEDAGDDVQRFRFGYFLSVHCVIRSYGSTDRKSVV